MNKRTLSDYVIEIMHLEDKLNSFYAKGLIDQKENLSYFSLLKEMEHIIGRLWVVSQDFKKSLEKDKENEKIFGSLVNKILSVGDWEYFKDNK